MFSLTLEEEEEEEWYSSSPPPPILSLLSLLQQLWVEAPREEDIDGLWKPPPLSWQKQL